MKRKGIAAVALAVIILSIGLMLVIGRHRQEIRIYINREDIHYIVANIGMGSQRLNYREHQEILDRIVTMVNGEYRYKKHGIMTEGVAVDRIVFGSLTKATELNMSYNMSMDI